MGMSASLSLYLLAQVRTRGYECEVSRCVVRLWFLTHMALCISCENIQLPIVTNGQAADGHELHRSVAKLTASARTCRPCALFLDAISGIRLKGIRHDAVRLFSWASVAAGDPVGLSRVFVRVGDKAGRFVNVHAGPGASPDA